MMRLKVRNAVGVLAALVMTVAIVALERQRAGVGSETVLIGQTPATIYRGDDTADTVVVVSHGFAGSRQMVEAIALTLARAGFPVVSFDYLGHGRNPVPMSADVTRITGTTEDLVRQTLKVVAAAREMTGRDRIALVGHSMATDVVVRAAARLGDVEAVVAISMYSEAVTPEHPERLLIISGARETRLREVALEAAGQIGEASEGKTVSAGEVERRVVVAPVVGHVGVLWSPETLSETASWIGRDAAPVMTGPFIGLLLGSILLAFWPICGLLGPRRPPNRAAGRRVMIAAVLPAPFALVAVYLAGPAFGLLGFGALAVFLAVWGAVSLIVLRPKITRHRTDVVSFALLSFWGLGVFAMAMDRYAAAFLPVGPRSDVALLLLPAAILFSLGDRALVEGQRTWARFLLRVPVVMALGTGLALRPQELGVLFTVLPVLILYFAVYGTMTRWAQSRSGLVGPACASGVILAWSIAGSTPLFGAG